MVLLIRLKYLNILICFAVVTILIGCGALAYGNYNASRELHTKLLSRLVHAPMTFFDTTPLGRIINRFSKDLDVLDTQLPHELRSVFFFLFPLLAFCIVIAYNMPIILTIFVPVTVIWVFCQVGTNKTQYLIQHF